MGKYVGEQIMELIENTQSKSDDRSLSYIEAEREILIYLLKTKENLVLMGQGVNDDFAMFGLTNELYKQFGTEKIIDTPLAETGLTGIATGLAINNFSVLYMHNRPDFMFLTLDQLINHASKYSYMSGGQIHVPLVLWAVTGQGWGCAAQHSQSIQGILMQVPGLKIVMPTTPYDAKGLLHSALSDGNPIVFLEHRRLLNQNGIVPEEMYSIPLGKGVIRKEGKDITIIAISAMMLEALEAAAKAELEGISVEVLDLRTIKPYDKALILQSVQKTKRVIIADTSWLTGGVGKEISDFIYSERFGNLKSKIEHIALPDVPAPAAYVLEDVYYPNVDKFCNAIHTVMK